MTAAVKGSAGYQVWKSPISTLYAAMQHSRCAAATFAPARRWTVSNKENSVRKLGNTIATLARYRRQWAATLQTVAGPRVRGEDASVVPGHLRPVTDFGSNPGALRMFAYVPPN